MALTFSNQAVIAFKNLSGKSNTDVDKFLGNEAEGIFQNVDFSKVWTNLVGPTPSITVGSGFAIFVTASLVIDVASNGHAYFALWPTSAPSGIDPSTSLPYSYGSGLLSNISSSNLYPTWSTASTAARVIDSIPPSYGYLYGVKPFDNTSSAISVGDPRDWIYQYQSGIFFQQDNVGNVPASIALYAYTGNTLQEELGSLGVGSITGITAGNGLSGGGTQGFINLDVNLLSSGGLTFSGDDIAVDYSTLSYQLSGNGLTANGGTLSVNLGINGGLTYSGGTVVASVDGTTIQIINGQLVSTSDGDISGVTAGAGLSGGGTQGFVTLDVNTSNGLSIIGDDVALGGVLSQNTFIDGSGYDFNIDGVGNISLTASTQATLKVIDGGVYSSVVTGTNSVSISSYDGVSLVDVSTKNTNTGVSDGSTNNRLIVTDGVNSKGFVYNDDYSVNFTDNSLVTKKYVDSIAAGLDPKLSVKAISATLSITLAGTGSVIDGYTVLAGDRILVNAQSGPTTADATNGIYSATGGSWSRADDSDGNPSGEVSHGNFVFVENGTVYLHTGWVLSITDAANPDNILVGTNSQLWVQFSEFGNLNAGDGLYYTGDELNVGAGTGLTVSANSISIDTTGVTSGNYGDSSSVILFNVNSQGQLVSASTQSISIQTEQITNFTSSVVSLINGADITEVNAGLGLTGGGTQGSVTLSSDLLINGGLTYSGNQIEVSVDGTTIQIIDGYLVSTTEGDISGVTAGAGLSGGGTQGFVTLDVNTGLGLTISTDDVAMVWGGTSSGLTFSNNAVGVVVDGNTIVINNLGQLVSTTEGDISGVTAGNGLSGGGSSGYVTLDVNTGLGLTISTNDVAMVWGGTSSGLTFSNNAISVSVDNTSLVINNLGQLSVIAGVSTPVYQYGTPTISTGDNSPTGLTLSFIPNNYSRVEVFVNGQKQRLGDGVSTTDCYFGSSPKALNTLTVSDELYWNGVISGFELTSTDVVEIVYES